VDGWFNGDRLNFDLCDLRHRGKVIEVFRPLLMRSKEVDMADLRAVLEQELVGDPDDLAAHQAYADLLQECQDPADAARGEFIAGQIALEDEGLSDRERQRLQRRERSLLAGHARTWLGELAPYVYDQDGVRGDDRNSFSFRCGWLDVLEFRNLAPECAEVLARSPQIRLLRDLIIEFAAWDEDREVYRPLCRSPYLGNVLSLQLGRLARGSTGQFRSCITAELLPELVRQMPQLEDLRLFAQEVDTDWLFRWEGLRSLQTLQVYHMNHYPLETLAANPSLGRLTELLLYPHSLEDGEQPYLRLDGVRALVRSPHLTSLRRLQLCMCSMGDAGCAEIVESGILARLRWLDLRYGTVGDRGALLLARCPQVKNLEWLDLSGNCLGAEGLGALAAAGIRFKAGDQWEPWGEDEEHYQMYLYEGDCE
jgi:uncharacterized protein (TIGR02996 family)